MLPEAYLAPRELRELLRDRATLTRMRSAVKNRVHAILAKHGIIHQPSDLFAKSAREFLAARVARCATPATGQPDGAHRPSEAPTAKPASATSLAKVRRRCAGRSSRPPRRSTTGSGPLRDQFKRITTPRGRKIAKVAIARQNLTPSYHRLHDAEIRCLARHSRASAQDKQAA